MNNKISHVIIVLALSLTVSGCAAGNKSTGGNQNTGNPSSSSQSGGSSGNSAGTVQNGTPQSSTQGTPTPDTADKPVVVDIVNAQKTTIGTAEFKKNSAGVEIKINVSGLAPGKHGIHIHQNAICEAPDFKSAGDHLNPDQKKHGMDNPEGTHAGDLANIEADAGGKVNATIISKSTTMDKGKMNSLLGGEGKSLVIHAQPDDGKTDPSGNSGDRIACGIIK